MGYYSTDPGDYIVERYQDTELGLNPHTLNDSWFRLREWHEETKDYIIHPGFGSRAIIETILRHRGIDVKKLPKTVDLYMD